MRNLPSDRRLGKLPAGAPWEGFILCFVMPSFAAFLLSVLALCYSECLFAVQAKMFADCTFGKITDTVGDQNSMAATFTAKLASHQNVSHSCVVKTNEPNHFLRVKAKRNKQSEGNDKICFCI